MILFHENWQQSINLPNFLIWKIKKCWVGRKDWDEPAMRLRLSVYCKPSTYVSKNERPEPIALHAFSSPTYSPNRKKSRWLTSSPRHSESSNPVFISIPKNVKDLERHTSFLLSTVSPLPCSQTKRKLEWVHASLRYYD